MVEWRNKQQIDSRLFDLPDLLFERTDQTRRPVRSEELNGMRGKRHDYGFRGQFVRAFHDLFQDLPVSTVQAVKISDAYYRGMRDVRIGQ